MNHYIFYTKDGFTQDKNGNETENCQILGWAEGNNPDEAYKTLLKDNEWLKSSDYPTIKCQQLTNPTTTSFNLE